MDKQLNVVYDTLRCRDTAVDTYYYTFIIIIYIYIDNYDQCTINNIYIYLKYNISTFLFYYLFNINYFIFNVVI